MSDLSLQAHAGRWASWQCLEFKPEKKYEWERVGCLYKERRKGWKHMYLDDEAAIGIYNSWHMRAGKDGWQDKQI